MRKRIVGGGNPFYLKFCVNPHNRPPLERSIFARSASAVIPSEKSSIRPNTNRKSTMHFPMSLIRWTSYVTPKPQWGGAKKTQNGRFPSTIALRLTKVCYKVSLCKYCRRQSYKAFMVWPYLSVQNELVGDVSFCVKIWQILTHPLVNLQNADFLYIFSRRASAVTSSKKFN